MFSAIKKLDEKILTRKERAADARDAQKRKLAANLGRGALGTAEAASPVSIREFLDKYSVAPRIPGRSTRELMHTTTFREGLVSFGDNSNDATGRVIHPNNGTCAVISQRGGDVATVVNVVALTEGSGKSPVAFSRTVISGLHSDTPTVGAPEILDGAPLYNIDREGIDFIKIAPNGMGMKNRVIGGLPERQLPAQNLTPGQWFELEYMATAVNLVRSPEPAS